MNNIVIIIVQDNTCQKSLINTDITKWKGNQATSKVKFNFKSFTFTAAEDVMNLVSYLSFMNRVWIWRPNELNEIFRSVTWNCALIRKQHASNVLTLVKTPTKISSYNNGMTSQEATVLFKFYTERKRINCMINQ